MKKTCVATVLMTSVDTAFGPGAPVHHAAIGRGTMAELQRAWHEEGLPGFI